MSLLRFKWYRGLFSKRTFVKSDDEWIDIKNYTIGKVTEVDGVWNNQVFCICDNELVHSHSFIRERNINGRFVYDYKCSNCNKEQHMNPDIIPGLLACDFNGNPI